jgi:RNA polymerase sigma-70 factor, ECF subfamily
MSEASLPLDARQTPDATDLIARARDDVAAFGELYRRYYDLVFRYCRRRLFLREAAEDLTAEVFLKAVEKFDGFRGDELAFRAWLYRLATNCANQL